jgi:hypothetical protein
MINKTTGERKDVHDGTAYTPAVRVEIDGTRVYICQDSGWTGDLIITDLDLNYLGCYTDYGNYKRVTSVAFSNNRIFIGQIINNGGRIVVLNKSNNPDSIATWANGYLVNDVKYQGDAYKSIVVAHQTGILRISTDVGNAGQILASFNNGGANTPATDMVLRSDAVFGALASSSNGLLVKLDPTALTWLDYWDENTVSPRVLKLSLNGDKSKITASVIRNGQGAFKTFNTSDLSLIDSCFISDPRCSSYDGNAIYLVSGSGLYQVNSNDLPDMINYSISISGPINVYHTSIKGRFNTYKWTASVAGGTGPYTYAWKWNGNPVGSNSPTYSRSFGWSALDEEVPFALKVQITDLNGNSATSILYGIEYYSMAKQAIQQNELPTTFAFYSNYPNPFNPETEIKFDLPEPARVKIVIYDLLGREIVNLFDGMKEAGYHSVRWNSGNQRGNKLSSGIYFCRINLRGESGQQYNKVLKMLLTK